VLVIEIEFFDLPDCAVEAVQGVTLQRFGCAKHNFLLWVTV